MPDDKINPYAAPLRDDVPIRTAGSSGLWEVLSWCFGVVFMLGLAFPAAYSWLNYRGLYDKPVLRGWDVVGYASICGTCVGSALLAVMYLFSLWDKYSKH